MATSLGSRVPPAKPAEPSLPLYSWRTIRPLNLPNRAAPRMCYIRNLPDAELEVSRLTDNGPFGFDLEWKPTYTKGQKQNPVALVQLANNHVILLIQISAMPRFPSKLQRLLESPSVVKTGVGIQYDTQKLFTDYAISTRNCVDLSLLARSVDNAHWKGRYSNPIGLARLVETYEKLSLPKGKIQRSNWEAVLNNMQQDYAANDAHSGFVIYTRLMSMISALPHPLSPVCYSFNSINGTFYEPGGMLWTPHNPNYDPGPPPPPKVKVDPKSKETSLTENRVLVTSPTAGSIPRLDASRTEMMIPGAVSDVHTTEFMGRRGSFPPGIVGRGRGQPASERNGTRSTLPVFIHNPPLSNATQHLQQALPNLGGLQLVPADKSGTDESRKRGQPWRPRRGRRRGGAPE